MRDLWRKTTALFWENPILWLPVVCADLLAFCFTRLQKLLTRQLINSLLLGHSALTGRAIPPVVHDSDRVDDEAVCLVFRNVTYERVAGTSRYLIAGRGAICRARELWQSQRKMSFCSACWARTAAVRSRASRNAKAFLWGWAGTCACWGFLGGGAHSRSLGLPNFLWKFAGARDDKGGGGAVLSSAASGGKSGRSSVVFMGLSRSWGR